MSKKCLASPCRGGYSLIEAIVALSLLAVVLTISITFIADSRKSAEFAHDRAFAVQRAISLVEEVRSFSQAGGTQDASALDTLDDGVNTNPTLTIQDVASPSDVISGNRGATNTPSNWRYSRRLLVRPFTGVDTRDVRIVSALLYREEPDGRPTLLADVGTVLKTPGDAFPTTQTYDVYFLSMENTPGWWVHMSSIKPLMEATVTDLQARNPGLDIRAHWITKNSYGRDQRYMPFTNDETDSVQDIDWVYFYPGTMPDGESADYYYVPTQFTARVNIDGTETNGYNDVSGPDYNPWPYALADEYNHGMRYIDELRHFQRRCAVGSDDPDSPTWRIFLERLCSRPDDYENAILINLHGELLAMPAIRNYSDAAKDPVDNPGVRAVSHPRYLRTPEGTDLQIRVYAYRDPYEDLDVTDPLATAPPITVVIKNVDLAGAVNDIVNPTLRIQRIHGGVDGSAGAGQDGLPDPYALVTAPDAPSLNGEMYATTSYTDGDTVITFYNTPLTCYYESDSSSPNARQGLRDRWRLYGLQYIPSSTESGGDFLRNLTTPVDDPKNTARWIVTIPADRRPDVESELSSPWDGVNEVTGRLTIETRVGADLTTGIMWPPADRNKPENLSRTYAWWTDDLDDVPMTERSQFIGDPRHCPYADLKNAAPVLSFQNHYNWYWDNFKSSFPYADNDWEGYSASRLAVGWADDDLRIDVARYFELLRTALINTDSVWTTLTGYSYYYMAVGNEIGYDSANGFPSGIPVSRKPFYGTSGSRYERVITGDGLRLIKRGYSLNSDYWWGKHWIGELCPDDDWATWEAYGNLPTGASNTTYVRSTRASISFDLPRGTRLTRSTRRTSCEGCNSFFMIGTRSRTFYHAFNDGAEGSLTGVGDEVAEDYAFPLPTYAGISRPFRLDWSGSSGWKNNSDFDFTSDYPHNSGAEVRRYYDHPWSSPNGMGSSLIGLTNPAGDHTSLQVINGIDRTTVSGSAFIAKWSILTLIHSFLTAGEWNTKNITGLRIRQLPRIEIKAPTIVTELPDPDTITVQWSSEFLRWDAEKYTTYYPDGFDETSWRNELRYVLLYSKDSGETWQYMIDDASAVAGERPPDGYLLQDLIPGGDEAYLWSVPEANFPEGSYLIRAECYRYNTPLHYSHHMEKIFIER